MEKSVQSGFILSYGKNTIQLTRSSNLTPTEVVDWIRNELVNAGITDEPYTLAPAFAQVTSGYLADFQGLNYWLDKSQHGMSLRSVSESFEQSIEFDIIYGYLSNAGFVTLVYQNVLRRAPDTDGFNYWLVELAKGRSHGEIMVGFSGSAEYRSKTADSVGVTMVYAGMLQRSPDPDGFSYWEEQLGDSASLVDIISGFLDSLEYRRRF